MYNEYQYRRAVCTPCHNGSDSYLPIDKISIYSMSDLSDAFAEKRQIELEGLRGIIVCMRRSSTTPSNSIVVSIQGNMVCDCTVRIK